MTRTATIVREWKQGRPCVTKNDAELIQRLGEHGPHTPLWTLRGFAGPARITRIVDGDTIHLVLPIRLDDACLFRRFKVRIDGIDTPEMRSKDDVLRRRARDARRRVFRLVTESPFGLVDDLDVDGRADQRRREDDAVLDSDQTDFFQRNLVIAHVECRGEDKYGRALADLWVQYPRVQEGGAGTATAAETDKGRSSPLVNVAGVLLRDGLANLYDGGTKSPFAS